MKCFFTHLTIFAFSPALQDQIFEAEFVHVWRYILVKPNHMMLQGGLEYQRGVPMESAPIQFSIDHNLWFFMYALEYQEGMSMGRFF